MGLKRWGVDKMMDRKVQRELVKSMLSLTDIMRKINWADRQQRQPVLDILYAVDEQCRDSFSAARYTYYGDAIQGLSQTIATAPWENMGAVEAKDACQLCQDILHYLIKELREEKEIKKEIVFLPYKASMWDSLESVWKAAFDDKENCNTYVIPIPYGDRKPDGTAEEWHCEADQFPSYVPVLNWRDYSFEKLKRMRPDIIYIHNPYDNCNAVTSIDMQYYSSKLKACTDMLVYIPYFVMDGDYIPPNLCRAPGIINADKVIVQSEKIREQYEKYYPAGDVPKNKFLPLGSPKLDKVRESKREDFELPASWQQALQGRKAVFFNISITSFLRYRELYIDYLQRLFVVLRHCQNIVLWWRPHPLLIATVESMTPDLAKTYKKLVEDYRRDGWGIYDDTADLHRAICWTDVYFGDPSSVIALYKETKKPVFKHNLNYMAKKNFEFGILEFLLYHRLLQPKTMFCTMPMGFEKRQVGRKYVLYNLTQETLFTAPEESLKKIQRVIDAIKHQNEIFLWWCVSPAFEAAICHLTENLQQVFASIKAESQKTTLVFYDNSGDICRAALYTDAYYGDLDSILWVFQYKKKPVQLQDVHNSAISFSFLRQKTQPVYESDWLKKKLEYNYLFFQPPDGQLRELTEFPLELFRHNRREQHVIPLDWQKKMDGKYVVFYHLGPDALNDGVEMLHARLRYILQISASTSTVLWWYDDGELRKIIKEYHAEDTGMMVAYEAMERECEESPYCILDTTNDLLRAFAWTDICYADKTELFWLYKLTGKPIMLQNFVEQKETDLTLDVWALVNFLENIDRKKEDMPLPERWRRIIQGKKIILFCVSCDFFLLNRNEFLCKMKFIFNIIKKRKDVVFIWHTCSYLNLIMENVFKDKDVFSLLKHEYCENSLGIYDDAEEIHRLQYWSDAYYGDLMSLAYMYGFLGKIAMIENMDIS